jgi:hypothetical protein
MYGRQFTVYDDRACNKVLLCTSGDRSAPLNAGLYGYQHARTDRFAGVSVVMCGTFQSTAENSTSSSGNRRDEICCQNIDRPSASRTNKGQCKHQSIFQSRCYAYVGVRHLRDGKQRTGCPKLRPSWPPIQSCKRS